MALERPKIHHPGHARALASRRPSTLENRLILDVLACVREYGFTAQSVEETAGVSRGSLRGWQTGGRWGSPKLRSFCAVLETLGLTAVIVPQEEVSK